MAIIPWKSNKETKALVPKMSGFPCCHNITANGNGNFNPNATRFVPFNIITVLPPDIYPYNRNIQKKIGNKPPSKLSPNATIFVPFSGSVILLQHKRNTDSVPGSITSNSPLNHDAPAHSGIVIRPSTNSPNRYNKCCAIICSLYGNQNTLN